VPKRMDRIVDWRIRRKVHGPEHRASQAQEEQGLQRG
jgi:hypothetical protein